MGNHDEFDLDVRLGSGRSLMEGSPLRGGGDVTDTCETCETCPAICTGQTCADQATCNPDICPTQFGQQTCGDTQCDQNTCAHTCTCDTFCDQATCNVSCEGTCLGEHTCVICPPEKLPE